MENTTHKDFFDNCIGIYISMLIIGTIFCIAGFPWFSVGFLSIGFMTQAHMAQKAFILNWDYAEWKDAIIFVLSSIATFASFYTIWNLNFPDMLLITRVFLSGICTMVLTAVSMAISSKLTRYYMSQ